MIEKLKNRTNNSSYKSHTATKTMQVIVLLGFFSLFLMGNVSAANWDNIKSNLEFGAGISDYGKITIRNSILGVPFLQLDKVATLELKSNTEICNGNDCEAVKEITLYEDAKLIDEIRFIDLKTKEETSIKNYNFKVKVDDVWTDYNNEKLKGDSKGIIYEVKLEGELSSMFQEVDWQIKSQGQWIDEWAVWTSGLNVGLVSYYDFDEGSGSILGDIVNGVNNGTLTNMDAENWKNGDDCVLDGCLAFDGVNDYVNITDDASLHLTEFTINFWVKIMQIPYIGSTTRFVIKRFGEPNDHFDYRITECSSCGDENTSAWFRTFNLTDTSSDTGRGKGIEEGAWNMITLRINSTQAGYLIGGILNATDDSVGIPNPTAGDLILAPIGDPLFNGSLDEMGIWSRSLTDAEIVQLYNEGVGMTYQSEIEVKLNFPANDSKHLQNEIIKFNATTLTIDGNLINATLKIWDSAYNLIVDTTNVLTGSESTSTVFSESFSAIEDNDYSWNVFGCTNQTCKFAENNRTFSIEPFINEVQTYESSTVEGKTNDFIISFNYTNSLWDIISGVLIYNNTEHSGARTGTGSNATFTTSATAPSMITPTDVEFYWKIGLTNTSGTYYYNSTFHNQTVNIINMSLYGAPYTVPFINFTLYDEQTMKEINGTIVLTFDYKESTGETPNTFSYEDNTETNSTFSFCIDPSDETYKIDSILEYTATGYTHKFYNFKGVEFTNSTTEIGLYLLNESISTSFIIEVKDASYQPMEGVEVYVQVYDAGENKWFTSEISETNTGGQTVQHIFTEDALYRFKIYDEGTLIHTTSPSEISCPSTPCTVTIIIEEEFENALEPFTDLPDLTSTLTYDKSTYIITFTYEDTSGNFTQGRLYVIRSQAGTPNIVYDCNSTSSEPTAILTCNLATSVNGTYIATGYITRDSTEKIVEREVFNKIRDIITGIGVDGVLWSIFFFIGILMLGVYRPSLGIFFAIVGVILLYFLQLIELTYTAIIAIVAIGFILLIQVRRQ